MITLAEPSDAEAIADLVNGAYRGETARRGWTHEADLLGGQRTDAAMLRATMDGGSAILVWREAGALLGCVCLAPTEPEGRWSLGMLTVDPRRQAAGLGRRLLEAGEAHCRAHGGRHVEMTVIEERESLIGWYERRGYRPTGARRPFPYNDERIGLPRRPDLAFVVLAKAL